MAAVTFAVPWVYADPHFPGLKGVLEVQLSDLPQRANVRDLVKFLNKNLPPVRNKANAKRIVGSIRLYGTELSKTRLLESLIPELQGGGPRLLAETSLHAVHKPNIVLHIKDQSGAILSIRCSTETSNTSVFFPIRNYRLVFDGRRVCGDEKLASYEIGDGDTIEAALEQCGGGRYTFANVSDDSLLKELAFSETAPNWRGCVVGLNLEGRCENPACVAFGKMIIHPRNFDSFNLIKDGTITYPMCWSEVKPLTCGFFDCAWKFEGVKADDGVFFSSTWRDASGHKYHRFDADETYGAVEWESLLIVVIKRSMATAVEAFIDTKVSHKKDDDVELCSICWSKILPRSETTTQCGHHFHHGCINKWSKWCNHHESLPVPCCPICRREL